MKEEELQAGLMGIVASVNKLEAYSHKTADGVDLETANQEILAGTSRIRKKCPLPEVRGGVCKKHRKHRLLCTAESAGKSDGRE